MATQPPVLILDSIELEINQTIDRLIQSLNHRRNQLMTIYRDKREEISASLKERKEMKKQLRESRVLLDSAITHNLLQSMQTRIAEEFEEKMANLENAAAPKELEFLCDTRNLEMGIKNLGGFQSESFPSKLQNTNELFGKFQFESLPSPPIPPRVQSTNKFHGKFQFERLPSPLIPPKLQNDPNAIEFQSTVSVGKHGSAPGELSCPQGVCVEKDTGHIFVADSGNRRIQIFSKTGLYLNDFGDRFLMEPYGILIHQDNIFVTDVCLHALFLFTLPELAYKERVGKFGFGKTEFNSPRQLAISPHNLLYVPSHLNDRIKILDTQLNFKNSLQHQSITRPLDIKFTANQMFVLCGEGGHYIYILTLSGELVCSIIDRHNESVLNKPCFFCVNGDGNIIISQMRDGFAVFSTDGARLYTIGNNNDTFSKQCHQGITMVDGDKLVAVSNIFAFGLRIIPVSCVDSSGAKVN